MGRSGRYGRYLQTIAYAPLPSQARFHASTARFKGFSGPIGSGKSQALCQEALKLSYLNVGRMGLLGAPTYPMLRDATQTTLLEILRVNEIPYEHNKAENTITMGDTKSRILFRPVEEFDRLRGTNLAWFGLDELTYTQEDAWLVLEGRLRDPRADRLCGFAVWTPKGFDWVYRRFVHEPVSGYEAILAKPFENRHLLERVPDFYERLKHSYDEKFYQQEVLGDYLNMRGGLVYEAFRRTDHVLKVEPRPELTLLWALDFNVDPMCSVVAQIEGEMVLVLDEIVIERATTGQACEEFLSRFGDRDFRVSVYGDASGNNRQTTGFSDYQIIRKRLSSGGIRHATYKIPKGNPAVRERVSLMNAKLRSAAGEIQMRIDPKCVELVKDLEQVTFKPDTMVIDKEKDPRRTHLTDALGYLVWQECGLRVEAGERAHDWR